VRKFSDRLKLARKHAGGVSQQELADHLGASVGAVGNWETGRNLPEPATLKKIATFLKTTEDFLTGQTEEIKEVPASRFVALPIYGQLQTVTLENNLIDLVQGLPKAARQDRKHILGNIRAMLDELEERELKSETTNSIARTSEAQAIAKRAGDKYDDDLKK
jgi:transcriptional regulator with XRE-family HTH domain